MNRYRLILDIIVGGFVIMSVSVIVGALIVRAWLPTTESVRNLAYALWPAFIWAFVGFGLSSFATLAGVLLVLDEWSTPPPQEREEKEK